VKDQGLALVACPTYAGKDACLDDWVGGYEALTYSPKHAYQVDNTRVSQKYYNRLQRTGIDVSHLTPWPDWDRTFRRCWEMILERAEDLNAYWIFSVEADNVPAPESLQIMVDLALLGGIHLVTHAYPSHESAATASGMDPYDFMYQELGCMLITRKLLKQAIRDFEEYGNIALALFACADKYRGGSAKLWQRFEVKHLDSYHMEFPNLTPSTIPGLICPTPEMPENYGQEIPPSLREDG